MWENVRVDKYLSRLGLARRTELKKDDIVVKLNDKEVKPSKDVKEGDIIEFISPSLIFKVEVLKLPERKSVPTKERENYYRLIFRKIRKKEVRSEFIKWLLED